MKDDRTNQCLIKNAINSLQSALVSNHLDDVERNLKNALNTIETIIKRSGNIYR